MATAGVSRCVAIIAWKFFDINLKSQNTVTVTFLACRLTQSFHFSLFFANFHNCLFLWTLKSYILQKIYITNKSNFHISYYYIFNIAGIIYSYSKVHQRPTRTAMHSNTLQRHPTYIPASIFASNCELIKTKIPTFYYLNRESRQINA